MKITAIKLSNVRGYQELPKTDFSDSINIFIGPNNAGKSTILNSIFLIQRPSILGHKDITVGQAGGFIELYFRGTHPRIKPSDPNFNSILFRLRGASRSFRNEANNEENWGGQTSESEPENLIYPYLSKRKVVTYVDNITGNNANSVSGDFTNLYSKIDRLTDSELQPENKQYLDACDNILGFRISCVAVESGKRAVYNIQFQESIPLTSMGEGVANILGLIVDLCVAKDKIFLIEEPENDIHPKALKALLKLIAEKSLNNQFFISTHSNIVMKYLGSVVDSKIFNITNETRDTERNKLFVSKIHEVSDHPEDRRAVLEDLGYDFFDFDLWKGWIFFEESSAEILIRDYFFEWYAKSLLNKIRTFSTGGIKKIETKFDDFNKLFVFLHLEPMYRNKVWVIIDGGVEEEGVITKLKEIYKKSGWNDSNFSQFGEHDFERYYPLRFQEEVTTVLNISEKDKKYKEKQKLLEKVKTWIKEDPIRAKAEFQESAIAVITKIQEIETKINL